MKPLEVIDEYLKETGRSKAEFARACGLPHSRISDFTLGRRRPTPAQAVKISQMSGGRISVAELLFPEGLPPGALIASEQWHRLPPRALEDSRVVC